jgi:uncharacterized protein
MWRSTDGATVEYCLYSRHELARRLGGTVLTALDGQPARIHYGAEVRDDHRVCHASGKILRGIKSIRFAFGVNETGTGWVGVDRNGKPIESPDLAGAQDVERGFTPSTNTLALWRLNLAIGESGTSTAAWLRFPEMTVSLLPQRYTRTGAATYFYESPSHDFTAELEVDELGLIVRYGDLWERVAVSDGD